jgi:predicted RNA binding protein YcfA (HicA-like mRNA interferase family)
MKARALLTFDTYVHTYTHVKSRDVLSALQADGWRPVAQRGSHLQLKHPTKSGRVTVPHPKADLAVGILRSIERQSGVKLR